MEDRTKHYLRRLASLEAERTSWKPHWRDLAAVFLPRRSRFLGEKTNDGAKKQANLVDSTGLLAVRTLASGMQSGLTSPARPWFRLSLQDEALAAHDEAKAWLHEVQASMTNAFARSNFYDAVHMLYHELGVFGTNCMIVEEDANSVFRCRTMTAGEYSLDTDASGRVDTLYRRIRMSPRQIVEAWPDTCPDSIKQRAERDNAEWMEVLHAVEPNTEHREGRANGASRPWRSVYLLLSDGKTVLEDSGYYEFPALCPRWDVTGSDVYGRSPAMDALGDCKMLQRMRKDGLEALAKEVNPPLLVPTTLRGVSINGTPGAVNIVSPLAQGQQGVTPLYQVRANLAALEGTVEDFRKQIRDVFFNDLFMMFSQVSRQMTATEVAERNAEKMLLLGPVLDRLRSELFQPLIGRVFGVMSRQGLLPVPPQTLQGQEIKIEFVSILAQAQKQAGIAAVQQAVAFVGQVAGMNPGALDKLDIDEAIDQVAEMLGVPPRLIRSDDVVAELRAQREEQTQQAKQMQMMQQGVNVAQGAAKAARDAGVTDMMQQGGRGATIQ